METYMNIKSKMAETLSYFMINYGNILHIVGRNNNKGGVVIKTAERSGLKNLQDYTACTRREDNLEIDNLNPRRMPSGWYQAESKDLTEYTQRKQVTIHNNNKKERKKMCCEHLGRITAWISRDISKSAFRKVAYDCS